MNAEAETNQCRSDTRVRTIQEPGKNLFLVRFVIFRRLDGGLSQPRHSCRGISAGRREKIMKQFVFSQHRRCWGVGYRYHISIFETKEIILRAVPRGVWRNRIAVDTADEKPSFTIDCCDMFGLAYFITKAGGRVVGQIQRTSWLSPLIRVSDTGTGQTARTARVSPSLYEEFSLDLDGQAICLFRKAGNFSTPLICCCLDDSRICMDLMLSAGILLLGQGPADGGGGSG